LRVIESFTTAASFLRRMPIVIRNTFNQSTIAKKIRA